MMILRSMATVNMLVPAGPFGLRFNSGVNGISLAFPDRIDLSQLTAGTSGMWAQQKLERSDRMRPAFLNAYSLRGNGDLFRQGVTE
jgi:hypothetical protein